MITAYLAGIPSLYEGEDIEVRYLIYEDQELLTKKILLLEYNKPAIVGQIALGALLKELEVQRDKEIVIIINDASLNEVVKGTSTTKNKDVQTMAKVTREELNKFANCLIKDVSTDYEELKKWNQILK
jgi:hypothetical protein